MILKLNQIVRFRDTFNILWRIITALLFIVLANFYWTVFHRIPGNKIILTLGIYPLQTSIFNGALLVISLYAILKYNFKSSLYYALATSAIGFNLLLFILFGFEIPKDWSLTSIKKIWLELYFIAIGIIIFWHLFVRYSLILWKAILPGKKRFNFRKQAQWTVTSKKGQRVLLPSPKITFSEIKEIKKIKFRKRIFIGYIPLLLLTALITASRIVVSFLFSITDGGPNWAQGFTYLGLLIIDYICLWLLGYLWHQFRKSRIPRIKNVLKDTIEKDDLLYLRPFSEDTAVFSGRRLKPKRWLFSFYERSFTFEELISERLSFAGTLYKLSGSDDPEPGIFQLNTSNPNDKNQWREDIEYTLSISKLNIVTIGKTNSLKEEVCWIRDRGHLGKSLFILPPATKRKINPIWKLYTGNIFKQQFQSLKSIPKATSVLAFLFVNGKPIILTASRKRGKQYQSALDIGASILLEQLSLNR